MNEPSHTLWARGGKRAFDVVCGVLLMLALAPLLVLTALAVKCTSRGPLFFSQIRAGRYGQPFRVYKFRTMRGHRTPDPLELVPLDHPEITPVGRWLRRLKIDELPQLANVLTGKMSLIGPRPTLPDQVERYDAFQRRRLAVRPGLTGLAQVNGSTTISWEERIKYDVYYVAHCCWTLDMGILLRTAAVLVAGEGRFARPFAKSPYVGPERS